MTKDVGHIPPQTKNAPQANNAPYRRVNSVFPIQLESGQTWGDIPVEKRKAIMVSHENFWKKRYGQGATNVGNADINWTRG